MSKENEEKNYGFLNIFYSKMKGDFYRYLGEF